jgi:hypothetical protein
MSTLNRQSYIICFFLLTIFWLNVSISMLQAREATSLTPSAQWFEPNQGQSDSQFAYIAHDRGYTVFMGPTEMAYSLTLPTEKNTSEEREEMRFVNIRMAFMGANTNPIISGEDLLPGVSNYISGMGSFTDVPHYSGVRYSNLYAGIDMLAYSSSDGLQYDFHVAPNTNPDQIQLHFTGIENLEIASNGDLLIHAANNSTLIHKTPYSYQTINGLRQEVHSRYVLLDDQTVGFEAGTYDTSQALVIDPPVVYSTYIGSQTGGDFSDGIAVDAAGNAYITGQTLGADFPTTSGALDPTFNTPNDAFVTKMSPDGRSLIYSTYLGGNGNEGAYNIAIDTLGNAYVVGFTHSTNFPLTGSAFQKNLTSTIFVSKLNAVGNALLYSTRFGGTVADADTGYSIAVDKNQNAYITGYTESPDFPTRRAVQAFSGNGDTFVARFDTRASGNASLIYSTYLGGSGTGAAYDFGHAIAVDNNGNAYVIGETYASDFPTTANAYDTTLGGNWDTFVTRLDTNVAGPASMIYSTFLGGDVAADPPDGTYVDLGGGIAIDGQGNAYVTGHTYEPDFPVTVGAFDTTFNGAANDYDAFVAKIDTNATGTSSLVYSTFIGSSRPEYSLDIALGKAGVCIVGYTDGNNLPTIYPLQGHAPNQEDAFIIGLNADGSALTFSTYYGGSAYEIGMGVAIDGADNIYVSGRTWSSDFPTTSGAFDTTLGDYSDVFILKMRPLSNLPSRNYFTTSTPTLTWNRVSSASGYIVQVSRTATFSTWAFSATLLPSQLEVTTDTLVEGPYFWRVSANDGQTWSAVESFTIDLP